MSRIFLLQAKNVDVFRRKTRRKLRKGDTIRIFGVLPDKTREQLDLRPKTKDVLFTKKYTNILRETTFEINVLEIGKSV